MDELSVTCFFNVTSAVYSANRILERDILCVNLIMRQLLIIAKEKKKLNSVRIVLELLAPEVEELNFLRRRFLSFTLSFSSTLLDGFLILRKRETLISELL